MFLESLIESAPHRQPRRGWTTMVSFGLQAVGIGVLVLVPLLYTGALPPLRFAEPIGPPAPRARPQPPDHVKLVPVPSNLHNGVPVAPRFVPTGIWRPAKPEVGQTTDPGLVDSGVEGLEGIVGTNDVARNDTIITRLLKPALTADVAPPPAHPIRVSTGVVDGLLIRRVEPVYPILAIQTRTQGHVVLTATIGKDGHVESLQVVSGHPLLVRAAIEAVRQWRYRPFLLNGGPVEVQAEITVNFRLGG